MMKHGQLDISHLAMTIQSYSVLHCPTVPLSSILFYGIAAKTDRMAVGPVRGHCTVPLGLFVLLEVHEMRA